MILGNPWGLLALFSLPAILGLHFFREKKRTLRIGGLHLWAFAAIRRPVGRRFDRFIRNLPLLFQLLAALLLSLLFAGLDLPEKAALKHYTIILDNSISMQAGEEESALERARESLIKWAGKKDRYTLVTAGSEAGLLAGPFATKSEMLTSLEKWNPSGPRCNLEEAVNFATRFLTESQKILFITDNPGQAGSFESLLEVHSVGKPHPNAAFTFADRFRMNPKQDKIFLALQTFSDDEKNIAIRASAGGTVVHSRRVRLMPGKSLNLSFETDAIQSEIDLTMETDALTADDALHLAPVNVKTVRVYLEGFGELSEYFQKALSAVPYTTLTGNLGNADLVMTANPDFAPSPENIRIYVFPEKGEHPDARLASGREIVLDHNHSITSSLSLEGVLWPYVPVQFQPLSTILLSHKETPLLYQESGGEDQKRYRFNLIWDRTNIFRQTSWPVLILAIVEECRQAMPGLTRTNFRLGEKITLGIRPSREIPMTFQVQRNDATFMEYDKVPELLWNLPRGRYELLQDEKESLASFNINLLSPAESDLTGNKPREADWASLVPAGVQQTRRNMTLFYSLFLLAILFTVLSWIFQDTSR